MTKSRSKQTLFIEVSDDWYPVFEGNFVEISLYPKGFVCIWGADDFGVEKVFNTRIDSLNFFNKVKRFSKEGKVYNKNYFLERGFQYA